MKKTLLTSLATILGYLSANAADLYCGANAEQVPGSQVYNKPIFWEKMDTAKKPTMSFVLADGTVIKSDELTSESFAKISDGDTALGVSLTEGKPQLFIGKVKKSERQIAYTNMAMAGSFNGNSPLLIANGVSLLCKEY